MQKIKVGDKVCCITGAYKGKTGVVQSINREGQRATVAGINMATVHKSGGMQTKERSIHLSNILPYSEKAKKGSKVKIQEKDGKKVRVLSACGSQLVDVASMKKGR